MKLFQLVFICVLTFAAFKSQAQDNYYLIFDETCMDRLEYSFNNLTEDKAYTVYTLDISKTEKAILEIGSAAPVTQSYVPANFWRCDNADFSLEKIQSITTNGDQVYVFRRVAARQYEVSKVNFVSYYQFNGNIIQYFSPKYRFQFDLETGVIGENIAFETPRSEVYFEGRLDNDCTGAFIFRQYSEQFNKPPHTDIVFVPELGVVEERTGKNVEDAFNRVLHLERINGLTTDTYLKVACGKLDPNEIPTESDQLPNNPQSADNIVEKGQSSTDQNIIRPNPVVNSPDFHTVQQGETLYSIARNNDISLIQLLDWNDLNKASTIYPGDRLRVSPNAPSTNQFAIRGGDTNPAPYDINLTNPTNPKLPANYDEIMEGHHIVKPGETMASIALKYGFTEEKFREINGIAANRVPRIGQRLRTSSCDCPKDQEDILSSGNQDGTYSYFQDNTTPDNYNSFSTQGINKDRFNRDTPVNQNIPTFYDAQARNQQPYYEATTKDDGSQTPSGYDFRLPNTRKVHTVADGETIYTIARKYSLKVEDIRKWNAMEKNEVVIPFQRLYIEK